MRRGLSGGAALHLPRGAIMRSGRRLLRGSIGAAALSAGLACCLTVLPAKAQISDVQSGVATAQPAEAPTLPNSPVVDVEKNAGSTKTRPAFRLLPQFVPGSEDWARPYADWLDNGYNQRLGGKKE